MLFHLYLIAVLLLQPLHSRWIQRQTMITQSRESNDSSFDLMKQLYERILRSPSKYSRAIAEEDSRHERTSASAEVGAPTRVHKPQPIIPGPEDSWINNPPATLPELDMPQPLIELILAWMTQIYQICLRDCRQCKRQCQTDVGCQERCFRQHQLCAPECRNFNDWKDKGNRAGFRLRDPRE